MPRARSELIENTAVLDDGEDGGDDPLTTIADLPVIDPADDSGNGTGSGNDSDDGGPKRRGRKPGRKPGVKPRASTPSEKAVSVKGIEEILLAIHIGIAKIASAPEFELDRKEAEKLSIAMTAVAAHYNVVVDPKWIAWAGLMGVMGSIYAPRFVAIKARKSMEKEETPPQQTKFNTPPNPLATGIQPFIPPKAYSA
jgi:hypothetical protein